LAIGARYAASALVWKTIEFDAIDNGLYAAETSFLVILIGISAVAVAALAVHLLWSRPPIFKENYSLSGLICLLIVGFALAVGRIVVQINGLEILGGVAALLFDGFVIFPIAWLALNLKLTGRAITTPFVLVTGALFILTLSFGSRTTSGIMILAILIFYVAFRLRVKLAHIGVTAIVLVFFSTVVAPALVDVRAFVEAGSTLDASEIISSTMDQMKKKLTGEINLASKTQAFNYHLKYLKNQNMFVERAVNVQQLDYVVALAADEGTIGYDRLWATLITLLPSAIIEDKTALAPDYALWVYGALPVGFENFIEVTLFGNAYTYGGKLCVFLSSLFLFFAIFMVFRLWCPRLDNSLLAAFFITAYLHDMTAGSIFTLVSALCRTMPFQLLLFWGLSSSMQSKFAAKAA
jgi:hypothetical protein